MRQSLPVGAAIDAKRMKRWIDRFGAYRSPVTTSTIDGWITQFAAQDRDLAARILDVVEFYGQSQIHSAYREALRALSGWDVDPKKRKGEWRFAAMSGSAGESGDSMLYQFRVANKLDSSKYKNLFVGRRDLASQKLGPDDTVVLLDDFSGTGKQVCEAWNDPETAFGELLAGVGRVYLVLVAATQEATRKIGAETSLTVLPAHNITESDDIFSTKCIAFRDSDRKTILSYCKKASTANPAGFGSCGLLLVFQHRTPNNTIPILHVEHATWTALFPRHD